MATTPKTKRGKAQVEKLGRTKKTGGFNKIERKAEKEYGSKEEGKRVAGAIFQKMAREHKEGKKFPIKKLSKKLLGK